MHSSLSYFDPRHKLPLSCIHLCGPQHKSSCRGTDKQQNVPSPPVPATQPAQLASSRFSLLLKSVPCYKAGSTRLLFFWHFIPISTPGNLFTRSLKSRGQACVLCGQEEHSKGEDKILPSVYGDLAVCTMR